MNPILRREKVKEFSEYLDNLDNLSAKELGKYTGLDPEIIITSKSEEERCNNLRGRCDMVNDIRLKFYKLFPNPK
tara:strand:- start:212 stop:436 length:225 start_codon:yes stop_codon:yes gene_type:complete